MPLKARAVTFEQPCAFITQHHRHHTPPRGWKFGTSAVDGDKVVGVVIVGRPVARRQDDGLTLEVIRLCTDGTKNAASFLYGIARRVARDLGYAKIITYTLEEECGTSLQAAGWQRVGVRRSGSWSVPSRRRDDKAPTTPKVLWESLL